MALLSDIQAELLQGRELSSVLLKLRFLAARLESGVLQDWVKFESEGYPRNAPVPDYRKCGVSFTGSFNGPFGRMAKNIPIPPLLLHELGAASWLEHEERQGIAAIEAIATECAKVETNPVINASNLVMIIADNAFEGMYCHSVKGIISLGFMVAIQNSIRSRLLELTIQLEGLVPNVLDVDVAQVPTPQKTKEYAAVTNNITNTTIYGNQANTNVSNSGEGAKFNVQTYQGDVSALKSAFTEAGFDSKDASELAEIVASEQPQDTREPFGVRTKKWLGQNIGKAADKLGFAVAAKLIADAVSNYYGLS